MTEDEGGTAAATGEPIIRIAEVHKWFGDHHVLRGV